jgi:hypothetical protein
MLIMKLVIFKANIAIMILPKYRLLYRMSLYAIVVSFLVQFAPLIAALTMKGETLPHVAAVISTICNAFSLIATLSCFSINVGSRVKITERHITIWQRICIACLFFFPAVLFHLPLILALIDSTSVILSVNNDFRLRSVLGFSFVPFVVGITALIVYTKEQLYWERIEELLWSRNRTTEA